MGTPRKGNVGQDLVAPKIADKIRLLKSAQATGAVLGQEKLGLVLEEIKEILLPTVRELDKPIFPMPHEAEIFNVPKQFHKARGLGSIISRSYIVWLQRSGVWFVALTHQTGNRSFQEVNSRELAGIMLSRSEELLKYKSWRKDQKDFLDKMPFARDAALYNALFLQLFSEFFKGIEKALEEREKRLNIMKERCHLMGDFIQALDPLASREEKLTLATHAIFSERGCHASRCTGDYFSPEALGPFWKVAPTCRDSTEYKPFNGQMSFESLGSLIQRLQWIFDEIEQAEQGKRIEPGELFGRSSGRLPLASEESRILKELCDSIRKGER